MAKTKKSLYSIYGEFDLGGDSLLLEDWTKKEERFVHAKNEREAKVIFKKRFEEKFKITPYLGKAIVVKVE